VVDHILTEAGDYLNAENADRLILDSSEVTPAGRRRRPPPAVTIDFAREDEEILAMLHVRVP